MSRYSDCQLRAIVALLCAAGTSYTAFAEDNTESSAVALEEVIVRGYRQMLIQSVQTKKEEEHIVEVLSSDSMGQLPNVTVAESLVRLPGVNGARDRGNESLATVRGLGPRMTMGTVSGREVASSEPTRAVRWEIFPTEVVSNVKVYKSQSADLIAGGIAATIDIGTIDPLDHKGPAFVATAGPVYYDMGKDIPNYSPWGNRIGLSWVGNINDNLGIALGGTYQKQKNANAMMGSWGYTDGSNCQDINGDGKPECTPWGAADELKQINQTRTGAMAIVQWRADNFEMKFDSLYSKVEIRETQNQTWFEKWDYAFHPGIYTGANYTIVDGDVVAATFPNYFQNVDRVIGRYTEDKTLVALGWNGKWTLDNWTATVDVSHSSAKRDNLWQAVKFVEFPASLSFDFRDGVTPRISISPTTLNDSPTPTWDTSGYSDGPERLRDKISALAASARRNLEGGTFSAIDFGVRLADREKTHGKLNWKTGNRSGSGAPLSAYKGLYYYYDMPDLDVPQLLGGNIDAIANLAFGGFAGIPYEENRIESWKVKEKTTEAYFKGIYDTNTFGVRMTGNVGVRMVHVKTNSDGYDSVNGILTATTAQHSSTDILPSATLNFLLDDAHVLRFAAARVLSRPPLDELKTGRSLSIPTGNAQATGSGGNPYLDSFRANQMDVSFEWYFHPESMLAVSYFTKGVQSSIGVLQNHQIINGVDYLITGPTNGGGGYVNGIELTYQTPFYFIPGMENFGIYSNYSYVDSNLREFAPVNNPLPLSGLAKNTVAVDLWYSNKKYEARIGYKYHSPYTIIYGWNESALSRLQSETILDFSTSYQFSDMFGLKLQIGNLTNEKLRAYFDNKPNRLANKDATGGYQSFGRRYSLEGTIKF